MIMLIVYKTVKIWFAEFSLTSWLDLRDATLGQLDTLSQSVLLEELGLASYLQQESCEIPANIFGLHSGITLCFFIMPVKNVIH